MRFDFRYVKMDALHRLYIVDIPTDKPIANFTGNTKEDLQVNVHQALKLMRVSTGPLSKQEFDAVYDLVNKAIGD
jgi:hypothetical protein